MNDLDQWLVYGMFACLLNECDEEHGLASLMSTEADGEGMLEEFEDGDDAMYAWLAATYNPGDKDRRVKRRYPPVIRRGGWPLTLH